MLKFLFINCSLFVQAGKECGDVLDVIDGKALGSVRVSFGFMSSLNDVKHFLKMIYDCFVEKESHMNNNFDIYWKKLSTVSFDREITNGPDSKRNEQEIDSKLTSPAPITTHSIRLTDIILYPIKSCGGIYADSWYISNTGLLFDRHWMITNDDGVGLNQKREPKMTLVKPSLSKDFQKLNLSFEGCEPFSLEINSSQSKIRNNYITTNPVCQTKVCADKCVKCYQIKEKRVTNEIFSVSQPSTLVIKPLTGSVWH